MFGGTRGEPAPSGKVDLNGNAVLAFDAVDQRFGHVADGATVVDWKNVKKLQQFRACPLAALGESVALNIAHVPGRLNL